MFFCNTDYYSMDLVANGKEHTFVYVVIDDLDRLPSPDALSYVVVTATI